MWSKRPGAKVNKFKKGNSSKGCNSFTTGMAEDVRVAICLSQLYKGNFSLKRKKAFRMFLMYSLCKAQSMRLVLLLVFKKFQCPGQTCRGRTRGG